MSNSERTPLLAKKAADGYRPASNTDNEHDVQPQSQKNTNNATIKPLKPGVVKPQTIITSNTALIKPLSPLLNKIGPLRTSKTVQKLKLLPDNEDTSDTTAPASGIIKRGHNFEGTEPGDSIGDEDDSDENETKADVYSQLTRIKETPARKDAERLGKSQRKVLPRVTSYCTAGSYKMSYLFKWLYDRKRKNHTTPKLFDECIYTSFKFHKDDIAKDKDLIRLDEEGGEINLENQKDVFIFEYGVIVLWGFKQHEEQRFLKYISQFENEKLADENVQIEEFNYYITKSYQPRIYNDFITLRDGTNYMMKLSISHAIAQSTKISLFEELVDSTIEDTQDIPQQIATIGKVEMKRSDIMKSIGELFILRININLHGSVLDSPELMWSEPHLEPIYQATRGYLEINQRVDLLNQRLEVISDLLQMLKEQLGHSHEEYLEVIVIVLIAVEVIVSLINIIVDLLTDF